LLGPFKGTATIVQFFSRSKYKNIGTGPMFQIDLVNEILNFKKMYLGIPLLS
jgi:hypothetical protein